MAISKDRKSSKSLNSKRLSRDDWLEKSLEVLVAEGPSHLRIEDIAAALGVTKGSFYHHFSDRSEFVNQIVRYWDEKYTREISKDVDLNWGDARDQLWQLMKIVIDTGASQYDVAIRAWAAREKGLLPFVEKAMQYRLDFVRSLFSKAGFRGVELDVRTRSFVLTMSGEQVIPEEFEGRKRTRFLKSLHSFLTSSAGS